MFFVSRFPAYIPSYRFWVLLIIMLDTIRRLFVDTRPVDIFMLVVELLVLLIIGIEGGISLVGWCKRRGKVAKVNEFMIRGQSIQSKAPVGQASPQILADWTNLADVWEKETNSYLSKHSAQAAATFLQDVSGAMMSFSYNRVTPSIRVEFERLSTRLINLRSIMEKPAIYF